MLMQGECPCGEEEGRVSIPAAEAQEAGPFLPNACTFQIWRPEACLSLAESEGNPGFGEQQAGIRGSTVYL